MSATTKAGIRCIEVVELVTDYLERQLSDYEVAVLEGHLAKCPNCSAYVEQMRQTISALGALPPLAAEPPDFDELLATFRART